MPSASSSAIADLRSAVSGPVHLRGEEGYAEHVGGFNLLSPNNPDLVVEPKDEAEVQAAVKWAVANGFTVHPQATGHGAYRTLDQGLLLKTTALNHIAVDPASSTWTMGSGLRWSEILPHLHAAGLGAVTGSAKTVGAVGLTLGGGIGPVGRTFGMAADWVRAYRVVDANGDVLVVSPDEHPDLFWALRGGKVGLGVITEITIEAVPMAWLYAGGIYYQGTEIDRLAHAWVDWIRDLPESVSTSFAIFRLPPHVPAPLGGNTWFHLRFAYVDPEATHEQLAERGEAFLASWRELAGPGVVDHIGVMSSDRVGEIHQEPEGPVTLWEYGDFLRDIDHDFIDAITAVGGSGADVPLANIEVRYHSGAYARDPELPSAIGGRREPFTLLVLGHPSDEVPWEVVEAAGHAVRDAALPWQGDELNFNWANHPTPERFRDRLWSPETRDRLAAIRSSVDPNGVFEFGN